MCRSFSSSGATRRARRSTVVSLKPGADDGLPWIVVDYKRGRFKCERCGGSEALPSSGVMRADTFALRSEAFSREHRRCEEAAP